MIPEWMRALGISFVSYMSVLFVIIVVVPVEFDMKVGH